MTTPAFLLLTLRVGGIVGLVAAVSYVRRHASASERHWLWMLALGGVLVLPLATALLPRWHVVPMSAVVNQARRNAVAPPIATASRAVPTRATHELSNSPTPTAALTDDGVHNFDMPTRDILSLALALWLAGSLVYAVRLVRAHAKARTIVRASRPWIDASYDGRTLAIRQSDLATAPFTYGVLRPTIILPADVVDWPAARVDAVVKHEAAHVSRDDGAALLLSEIACAVYWWHPAVRYAGRQAAIECERACDDVVLRAGMLPSDYGAQLLAQAQSRCAWNPRPLATIMFGQSHGLAARIRALLDPRVDRRPLKRSRALFAVAVGLGAVAFVAAAAPRETSAAPTIGRVAVLPVVTTNDTLPVVPVRRASVTVGAPRTSPASRPALAAPPREVEKPVAPATACVQADARQARTAKFEGFTFTGAGGFITADQGATVIVWSGVDCVAWIRFRNPINIDANWRAPTVLFGGELTMHDDNPSIARDYLLNSDGMPTLRVNGKPAAISASDEAWVADMIREYVRRTGYGATRRASEFLAHGGVPALLTEVAQIAKQDVRARYLQSGFDSVAEQNRAAFIHDGASLLDHAYSRGQFLLAVPVSWRSDERVLAAVYDEAALIEPDDIVIQLLRQTQPPRPVSPTLRPLIEKLIATLQSVDRRRGLGAYYLDIPPL